LSSQDTFPRLQLTVKGLEEVILVGHKLPDVPVDAILPLVQSLTNIGVDEAKAVLEKTSGSEKSTGKTAELMAGIIEQIKFPDEWLISIGPETQGLGDQANYPKFVNMSTGPVTMNRPVQLLPYPLRWGFAPLGKWRFIGVRPRIEGHPWMEGVRDAILKETTKLYGKEVYKMVGELNKKRINLKGAIDE